MNLFDVSASLTLDTSSFIRSLRETRNGMNDSKKSLSEYRSDVAKLAQQFKQSGMTSSEAWKKAYSEIDKSLYDLGKDTTESGTKVKSLGEIFEGLKGKFSFLGIGVKEATDKVSIFGDVLKANILSDAISKGFDMLVNGFKRVASSTTGFIKDAVNAGQNFDTAMSQVAATMGKSVDEIQNLRDFAKQMGATTKYSATESAQALNYMALAGYDAETSMKMLPNVMNLASAGAFDLARASDMLTDTQTAFGISLERTNQLVDEMAKAASTGNTSVEQLGDAFLTIGGLAKELNGGMVTLKDGTQKEVDGVQELEIALTSMANAGIKGSEAGTHMRNMLLKLSAPTEDATKFFEQYGIQIFDTAGNMNSLRDIFGQLNTQLSSMSQGDKLAAISDIFNARDTASAEALLAAIGENWDYIGDAIVHADGAASKMSQTQIKNLAGARTIMKSALEGLQITVSDALTPMLTDFVKFAGDSMQSVVDTVNKRGISGLPNTIKNIMKKAGQTIRRNIPDLVKNTLSVLTEIKKGIADGIEIIPTQIKQTIILINKNIREKAPEFLQAGINIKKNLISGISDNLSTVMEDITLTILNLAETLTEPENITTFVDTGITLLTAIGEGLGKSAGVLAEKAPEIIANVKQGFEDNKEKLKETGRTFLTAIADGLGEDWTEIETKISQGIENIDFAKITENISKLIIGITDTAGNVIDGIDWTVIGGAIGEALNGVDFSGIASSMLGLITTAIKNAPELLKGIAETIDSETALQMTTLGVNLLIGKEMIGALATYLTSETALASLAPAMATLFSKCAPAIGAAIAGWDIGTLIYNANKDSIDNGLAEIIDGVKDQLYSYKALWDWAFNNPYGLSAEQLYKNIALDATASGIGYQSDAYREIVAGWEYTDIYESFGSGNGMNFNAFEDSVREKLDTVKWLLNDTANSEEIKTAGKTLAENFGEGIAESIKSPESEYQDFLQSANKWGQDFSQNFSDGISQNSFKVFDALDEMNKGIKKTNGFSVPEKGVLSTADTWMPDMMQLFADGIQNNSNLVTDKIRNLNDNIKTSFKENIDSANHWGTDLITNFINGANSLWDSWVGTWEDFGGVIYDLLHHSTPEKGLLKNDDEWMPDMMYNFISGIRDNIPALQQQAETAVSAIQTAFSSPVEMGDIEGISIPELPKLEYDESELEYNASPTVEVHTSLIDTVTKKLDEIGNRIIDVVVKGDFGIDIPKLQPQTIDIESRFNGFEIPQLPDFAINSHIISNQDGFKPEDKTVNIFTNFVDTVSRKLDEIGQRVIEIPVNSRFNAGEIPQLPDFETEDIQIEVTFLDNLAELLEKFRSFKESVANVSFGLNGNFENIDIPDITVEIPDFDKLTEKKNSIETTEIRNFREVYENEAYYTRVSETDRKAPYKPQQKSMQNNTNDDMQSVIGLLNGILNALQEREIVMPIDTLDTALGMKQSNETRWAMA